MASHLSTSRGDGHCDDLGGRGERGRSLNTLYDPETEPLVTYLPTPAEIRAACDEILAKDTPEKLRFRQGFRVEDDEAGLWAFTVPTDPPTQRLNLSLLPRIARRSGVFLFSEVQHVEASRERRRFDPPAR